MLNIPGEALAKGKGYSLANYTGNKKSATYTKHLDFGGCVFLTCTDDGQAELSLILGHLITCTSGKFSVPNKNFEVFERRMIELSNIWESAQAEKDEQHGSAYLTKNDEDNSWLGDDFDNG